MKHILITGATGMIGKKLIRALSEKGHTLSILSRKPTHIAGVKVFLWDIYKQEIDKNCLDGVDTIIHLAGENIAEKKWTESRKQEIIKSRVLSTQLLYQLIHDTKAPVTSFISASAVGYYGDCGDEILTEQSDAGFGFLADCCQQWEHAVDQGKSLGIRIVKMRTGFILDRKEGGLPAIEKPVLFFVGAALGNGKQWIPWIHIDDMIAMYLDAVEDQLMMGAYNACAPYPVTNETLTKAIAKEISRPVWPFNVPEKILKLILGEMSVVALMSTNTSAEKILESGFRFKYHQLEDALTDIYKS